MREIGGVTGPKSPPAEDDATRLRQAAHDLEGVFLSQLFRAMRETVHEEDGILGGSPDNDMFASMFDEVIAQVAAQRLSGSVGDALYVQLRRHIPTEHGNRESQE